jgi:hypothetical protein
MLIRLLILTVILAVGQAPSPVPRQATDNSAQARGDNQKESDNKSSPSGTSPATINQNKAEPSQTNINQQGGKDTDNSISISKLPTVTITANKRDWADWGYWGFSCLLALTGIFQIWLLFRTYKISTRQAEIASDQETQMRLAGRQTERILAQMEDTAVRDLRAYVGVSRIKLDISNMQTPEGLVEIQNFGKTPAYKVRHWTAIGIQPYPPNEGLPELPVTAKSSVTTIFPQIKNLGHVALKKPLPQGITPGTRELTVYVYGRISYEDAFKNDRYSNFRFIFGGEEESVMYKDEKGKLWGAMRPDVEGNDAN